MIVVKIDLNIYPKTEANSSCMGASHLEGKFPRVQGNGVSFPRITGKSFHPGGLLSHTLGNQFLGQCGLRCEAELINIC